MKFHRHFTKPNLPIEQQIIWKKAESKISKSNGDIVFEMQNIEVPDHWSQQAINILAQKYFRKAGVPSETKSHQAFIANLETPLQPDWLTPQIPTEDATFGSETSAKQVFHRLAGAWTYWGWKEGIFKTNTNPEPITNYEENAQIFYDEIYFMLAHQYAAPNSPQFFNTGLFWAYGIKGDANGQWAVTNSGEVFETTNSYEYSQPHACFLQPISDNLIEKGGIFDLLKKEALLFKHGSGTGTNFSNLRGKNEFLGGGGVSSGLMSFLKIFDTAAGAISSGGTTRRAAKLVCLDPDHPEIEEFIDWKMKEERKARALVIGSMQLDDGGEVYSSAFEGEAINTVSGQNSNNSIRITEEFLHAIDNDLLWNLTARTTGKIVKTISAKYLWNKILYAAWMCADPGLLYHDTINEWHTCKADGIINTCNPCGEYQFLDDTACNLASLNLGKFLKERDFQTKDFEYATRLWTIVLEISVYMASFPSKEIAQNSYTYRTLGLGYMNLGGLLMRKGYGYDSDEGRDLASSITALMHGVSYLTSQEMALELGAFPRWGANSECMTKVIINHKAHLKLGSQIWAEANTIWNKINIYERFRNAQVTLQAPTGTIHLVTDCDTSGIEPDFSLIKYKQLSGGGMMQIVNECIPEALSNLGYSPDQIPPMLEHIQEFGNLENYWITPGQNLPEEHLKVFDCANPSGNGTRYLSPLSHVKMMAAIQPFLSGAISKTCNLPNSATIEDVDFIYREANRLKLKAIAIYRDGSKLTQPLSSRKEDKKITPPLRGEPKEEETYFLDKAFITHTPQIQNGSSPKPLTPAQRKQLPPLRKGYRQKVRIDGQSVYLSTGEYSDGTLGEIWLEISKEGSTLRAMLGAFSKLASTALQFGVPLEQLVNAFVYTKFEPAGIVEGHDNIKITTSVLDFVFRDLAIRYLNQKEFANSLTLENDQTPIFLDLDSLKSPLPLHEKTLETELVAYAPQPTRVKVTNFTGNACPNCGHFTLIQTGSCTTCTTCYANTGCG